MKDYIRTRVLDIATYLLETGQTVRQAADVFHVSKSTVHKDVTERLEKINKELYLEVSTILAHNKAERHLRGGEATKKKYITKRKQRNYS